MSLANVFQDVKTFAKKLLDVDAIDRLVDGPESELAV